jgi:hypothetical protein
LDAPAKEGNENTSVLQTMPRRLDTMGKIWHFCVKFVNSKADNFALNQDGNSLSNQETDFCSEDVSYSPIFPYIT